MTFVPESIGPGHSTQSTPYLRKQARERRTIGEDAVPVPSHTSKNIPDDYRTINGWGADLDPANRPAVPRELPSDVRTVRGDVKYWQQPHMKIFISNEQPGLTPVFGETCPPHGLSGLIREYAFQYGEASARHWMMLMLADRVERLEYALTERENRPYVLAGGAALVALGVALLVRRRR